MLQQQQQMRRWSDAIGVHLHTLTADHASNHHNQYTTLHSKFHFRLTIRYVELTWAERCAIANCFLVTGDCTTHIRFDCSMSSTFAQIKSSHDLLLVINIVTESLYLSTYLRYSSAKSKTTPSKFELPTPDRISSSNLLCKKLRQFQFVLLSSANHVILALAVLS